MLNRRLFPLALIAALALPVLPALAADDDEGPLVPAAKILDALTAKDIVLDRPGQPTRPGARPVPEPGIDLRVQFTFGSAELMPKGKRQLDELAMALNDRALATARFQLAGHTDAVGTQQANLRLSLARADAVKDYLASAHGLAPSRLTTLGYGASRPVDKANPGAAVNRRVEVRRLAAGSPPARPEATTPAGGRLVPTPQR